MSLCIEGPAIVGFTQHLNSVIGHSGAFTPRDRGRQLVCILRSLEKRATFAMLSRPGPNGKAALTSDSYGLALAFEV